MCLDKLMDIRPSTFTVSYSVHFAGVKGLAKTITKDEPALANAVHFASVKGLIQCNAKTLAKVNLMGKPKHGECTDNY